MALVTVEASFRNWQPAVFGTADALRGVRFGRGCRSNAHEAGAERARSAPGILQVSEKSSRKFSAHVIRNVHGLRGRRAVPLGPTGQPVSGSRASATMAEIFSTRVADGPGG
jgi:hypothetical protein